MITTVVGQQELAVETDEDVAKVRRLARTLAGRRGFDAFALVALTTAASEITRNAVRHGGGGVACIEELIEDGRGGVRLTVTDQGPGIADIDRVLRGGYSTAKSLGLGVSGTRRLVDEFLLDSAVGQGTKVVITKWTRH